MLFYICPMTFRIHKEGTATLLIAGAFVAGFLAAAYAWNVTLFWVLLLPMLVLFGIVLQFFRNPVRQIALADNNLIYAPCDGKICVIEEVEEPEYFQGKRLQVSIFMSPFNVHVNRNPVGGTVKYVKYHPGKFLVAWHPKSSTENERTTIVYDNGRVEILMRQIAGALARRIVCYLKEGQTVEQGGEMGFIKFGSRVDLFLPPGTEVVAKMDEQVRGNVHVIARLSV